jgi:hypothetical protein
MRGIHSPKPLSGRGEKEAEPKIEKQKRGERKCHRKTAKGIMFKIHDIDFIFFISARRADPFFEYVSVSLFGQRNCILLIF